MNDERVLPVVSATLPPAAFEPRRADISISYAADCGKSIGAALHAGQVAEAVRSACQCGYFAGMRKEMLDATLYPLAAATLTELARLQRQEGREPGAPLV
jgi:hypothetical protein